MMQSYPAVSSTSVAVYGSITEHIHFLKNGDFVWLYVKACIVTIKQQIWKTMQFCSALHSNYLLILSNMLCFPPQIGS